MEMFDELSHKAERAMFSKAIDIALNRLDKDREKTLNEVIDLAEKYMGDQYSASSYAAAREAIKDPNNKWVRFINRVIDETDKNVAKTMLLNLGYEAFFRGTKMIRANREKYHCNIPWLILFDPTSACNMHCAGCWSGTYGHKYNLTFEEMDKIVTQGKELGVYLYMMTGGEPLVRKADVLKLAEKHNDCEFAIYDNSTLIDDAFCKECVRLGNLTFFLSIEGSEETNDARRGEGHYKAFLHATELLQKYGIVYGTSICYTSKNIDAVTSDDFFKFLSDRGARYGFYFHYMPVGNNAVPELLPTPEQREYMINRIREIRSSNFPIEFYPMDFQNDGEYVGGCIAGGRNYFHINSNGDAEPCVFIHYSDTNIKTHSILEMLQSPLFMEYHKGQPFNKNHLKPCPMLENPEILGKLVERSHAKNTDFESPETTELLKKKTVPYAEKWSAKADEIWAKETHKPLHYVNYRDVKED